MRPEGWMASLSQEHGWGLAENRVCCAALVSAPGPRFRPVKLMEHRDLQKVDETTDLKRVMAGRGVRRSSACATSGIFVG
jgi:hypothetical protein